MDEDHPRQTTPQLTQLGDGCRHCGLPARVHPASCHVACHPTQGWPAPTFDSQSTHCHRMRAIRSRALARAKPPAQGGDERTWLHAFLDERVAEMRKEPAHSDTSRVDTAAGLPRQRQLQPEHAAGVRRLRRPVPHRLTSPVTTPLPRRRGRRSPEAGRRRAAASGPRRSTRGTARRG
ncbi:chitosanase [Micromonospora echinofusca]|uniref:chitosanase n=1 Tax=Micromonospora echinofusca TaxID=47858 RepID=UPI0033F55AEA